MVSAAQKAARKRFSRKAKKCSKVRGSQAKKKCFRGN